MNMTAAFSSPADIATTAAVRRINRPAIRPSRTSFLRQRSWKEEVNQRLTELMQLPPGWDGYAAVPVGLDNAAFAFSALSSIMTLATPVPSIVPTVNGSLQIEWHTSKGDIELRIRRPNSVHAWFSKVDDDDESEVDLTLDFRIVSTWLHDIGEIDLAVEPAAA
jgi:hypothetical protein